MTDPVVTITALAAVLAASISGQIQGERRIRGDRRWLGPFAWYCVSGVVVLWAVGR